MCLRNLERKVDQPRARPKIRRPTQSRSKPKRRIRKQGQAIPLEPPREDQKQKPRPLKRKRMRSHLVQNPDEADAKDDHIIRKNCTARDGRIPRRHNLRALRMIQVSCLPHREGQRSLSKSLHHGEVSGNERCGMQRNCSAPAGKVLSNNKRLHQVHEIEQTRPRARDRLKLLRKRLVRHRNLEARYNLLRRKRSAQVAHLEMTVPEKVRQGQTKGKRHRRKRFPRRQRQMLPSRDDEVVQNIPMPLHQSLGRVSHQSLAKNHHELGTNKKSLGPGGT